MRTELKIKDSMEYQLKTLTSFSQLTKKIVIHASKTFVRSPINCCLRKEQNHFLGPEIEHKTISFFSIPFFENNIKIYFLLWFQSTCFWEY